MKLSTLTIAAGLAVSSATALAQGVTDPQIASIVVTVKVRPAIAAHLQHAKTLQASLAGKK